MSRVVSFKKSAVASVALACVLVASAAALWMSAAPSGHAATSTYAHQPLSLTVVKTISWSSVSACTQAMPGYDFGTLAAAAATSSTFTGCVSSNTMWDISAQMTTPMTDIVSGDTVGGADLVLQTVTTPPNPAVPNLACDASQTTCVLAASETAFTNAKKQDNAFTLRYRVTVPATSSATLIAAIANRASPIAK